MPARSAATATCRRPSPSSSTWTSWPRRSAWTRSTFRLKNAQDPGEVTPQGMHFKTCGLKDCLTHRGRARATSSAKHRAASAAQQAAPAPLKRGVGMASMLHVGGGAKIYPSDGCGTILKIDDFAHVTLITGASEIGQGSETVLAQLVCEELGLPMSAVTRRQQRHRHHALGRRRARQPHHLHRRQLGDRRGAQGARPRSSPRRRKVDRRCRSELDLRGGHIVRAASGEALIEPRASCCARCISPTRPSW